MALQQLSLLPGAAGGDLEQREDGGQVHGAVQDGGGDREDGGGAGVEMLRLIQATRPVKVHDMSTLWYCSNLDGCLILG